MSDTELKIEPLLQYFENSGFVPEVIEGKKIFKHFNSKEDEINSLTDGVGLRDLSGNNILVLEGKDVLDFLHRISTNSLKNVQANSISRTILTTEKGRIIDTVSIISFDDRHLLICSRAHGSKVKRWIEKYIITDDVSMNGPSDKYALLEVLGPQADSFMTLICGNSVNDIELNKFKSVSSEGVLFYMARLKDRIGKTKFWLWLNPENSAKLVDFMLKNKGIFNFNLIGDDAYNCYRINKGIPAAPNEINDLYNPHEANLTDLVSFTKGCYIGQEVIARLDTYDKVQKHLTGVSFTEPVDEHVQYNLSDNSGHEAGMVTSVVYSERSGKYIGLAYIRNTYLQEGTELTAKDSNGKSIKVIVESLPFRKKSSKQ
ncbi:MAG: glycine cleavage T C-terminal barrel domain-containing protein [Ignavibacteriaceae bacterium]|nr:glycine cleavage T C-terminal barrel domain-containing protein [Ignavibacteriaceae bacterium]